MPYATDALLGRTILVVEDEYLLADHITSTIQSAGGQVQGPFPSTEAALKHLAGDTARPDAATLNVTLLDGTSFAVAEELSRIGVPFIFASASDRTSLPIGFADRPILTKPFAAYQIVHALLVLLDGTAGQDGDGPAAAG